MSAPLIHIGYHKTGSSWLQKSVFRRPEAGFGALAKTLDSPLKQLLVIPNALDFDPAAVSAALEPQLQQIEAKGLRAVVSSERLAGHPFSGGYDSKELATRLQRVFPTGRVLIVIREQRGIILSSYKQYVKAGGPASLSGYLNPPERGRERVPLFDFGHYAYDRLIALYHELFAPDRVRVALYEQLANDPRGFVEGIAQFAGVEVAPEVLAALPVERPNLASRGSAVALRRRSNQLFRRTDINPAPLLGATALERPADRVVASIDRLAPGALARRLDGRLRDLVAREVGERYRESNRETALLTGLDLSGAGYDT